jgi:hypothetical protein
MLSGYHLDFYENVSRLFTRSSLFTLFFPVRKKKWNRGKENSSALLVGTNQLEKILLKKEDKPSFSRYTILINRWGVAPRD